MRSWLGDPEAKGLLILGACLSAWQFGPTALAEVRNIAAAIPLHVLTNTQNQQPESRGGIAMDDSGSPDLVFFDHAPGSEFSVWEGIPAGGIPVYYPSGDGMLMEGCDW